MQRNYHVTEQNWLTGFWARNRATIQQSLILKFNGTFGKSAPDTKTVV